MKWANPRAVGMIRHNRYSAGRLQPTNFQWVSSMNETSEQASVNAGCRATIREQEQTHGGIQAAMVLDLVVDPS